MCRASDERVTNIVRLDAQENSTAFSDAAQSASSRDDHRLEFSASVTQWHTGMVMDIGREEEGVSQFGGIGFRGDAGKIRE